MQQTKFKDWMVREVDRKNQEKEAMAEALAEQDNLQG